MKEKLLVVGVVIALILGALGVSKEGVVTIKEIATGAVSSPDLGSYAVIGGNVLRGGSTKSLTQATTTVCAIQSPSATSTLVTGSIKLAVSSTTAATVTIAKSANPYATTTSLGAVTIAANAQGQAVASTTGSHIFSPNTYLVVGMAGGIGTFSPTGECRALFMEI